MEKRAADAEHEKLELEKQRLKSEMEKMAADAEHEKQELEKLLQEKAEDERRQRKEEEDRRQREAERLKVGSCRRINVCASASRILH